MRYNPITILRMREFGESVLSNLASSDPRISGSVVLSHPTEADSIIGCAYVECVGNWIFVFSLIDGMVLFAKDQVVRWCQRSEFARTKLGCEPVACTETRRHKPFQALAA